MTPYKKNTAIDAIDDGVPTISFIDFAEEVLRPARDEEPPKRKKRTKQPVASE
jgi:hypothetical protein